MYSTFFLLIAHQRINSLSQTFGGPYESDGRLQGDETVYTYTCDQANNVCAVPVPAPALALVFLSSDALGESTPESTVTFATTTTAVRILFPLISNYPGANVRLEKKLLLMLLLIPTDRPPKYSNSRPSRSCYFERAWGSKLERIGFDKFRVFLG